MSRTLSPLALMLAGCPYIFGPPEIVTNTDSATILDTATPYPTDSIHTPSETNPDAPQLSELSVSARHDHVLLDFRVADMDGDLVGAVLTVDRGGTTHSFVVPSELDTWDQFGISTASVPVDTPCNGYAEVWDVTITDLGGSTSPTATVGATVDGYGVLDPGLSDVGSLVYPSTICGTVEEDGQLDTISFVPPDEVRLQFDLHWDDPSADLDLWVFQGIVEIGRSNGPSPAPETVTVDLREGEPHKIEVHHWKGPLGTWQLFVQEP